MPYEVTITKKETVETIKRPWVKLFDYTEAEQKQVFGSNRNEQYGYRETPTTELVETPILTQQVEEIDLAAVIKAINGL